MRRILISGGSRGIGAALVRAFCEKGDSVVFLYKNAHVAAQALAQETGAVGICADVSCPESVRAAIKEAEKALGGGVEVLVNNAGVSMISLVQDVSDEDWRRVIDTNLSGAFYLCRSVIPAMVTGHYGRIVNIGSMWGKVGASCEVAYSASKAGLRGLTLALAKELAPSGITVNCVEPGVIDTEMNRTLDEDAIAALVAETPVGRLGSVQDIAHTVLFFASDEASFVTGQILGVDGGIV